jgi:hypothetical protein
MSTTHLYLRWYPSSIYDKATTFLLLYLLITNLLLPNIVQRLIRLLTQPEDAYKLGWLSVENFFFSFIGSGETESTWYVGHYLAYCTSPGWWMTMREEQSAEWVARETATLSATNSRRTELRSNPGLRCGKPASNCRSYVTSNVLPCSEEVTG